MQRQLQQVAKEAGVPVGVADCGANLIVVLTPDPEHLRDWWGEEHRLFNTDDRVGRIERLLESEEAIRAWYNAAGLGQV